MTADEDDDDDSVPPTADRYEPDPLGTGGGDPTHKDTRGGSYGNEYLADPRAGESIGTYELIERVGEGAFGVVWRAWDTRLKRDVAVKFLQTGAESRENISRFRQEQEILAQLRHPNLATVFDFGRTANGQPYFVMEFVHGASLTVFCDREKLSLPRRLELFVLVCDAVQYAHSNNIAHRDLKPANILVEFGPSGVPRPVVIDFGLARSTTRRVERRGHDTLSGAMLGTPEYMSPEQFMPRGTAVDNLSDVYALGVILYELLTGTAPFDFRQLRRENKWNEIQRIVSDVDPPTPSAKLSTIAVANAELADRIARSRRAQIRVLEGTLAKELQWIPLKALKKDRAERYPTANALAEDVRRYLRGAPIQAAPDSVLYRTRKFVRRNRAGVAVASAAAISLAAVAAGVVNGRLAAAEVEVVEKQRDLERANQSALESRKQLLELQRASLLAILTPLLREEVESAGDSQSTARIVLARRSAAEAWRQFCERPVPDPLDSESRRELITDLRILGETALQAARWASSARTLQTGGGDDDERARWMDVAERARARIADLSPTAPEAGFLLICLQRSQLDVTHAQRKYDEVLERGESILATAQQVILQQADPQSRFKLEREVGRIQTTMADNCSRRVDAMLVRRSALAATDPEHARLTGMIMADRERELGIRQREVEARRKILEDASLVSPQTRHELMIALERLAFWYSNPKQQELFATPEDRAAAREREVGLDAEYRDRYLAVRPTELSDLERAEYAGWSVREAEASLARATGDADKKILQESLQDALGREVDLSIELMWRNNGDVRVHERLVVIQSQFLCPACGLDAAWKARMVGRIADLVVAPAQAGRAERRLAPTLAVAVRVLRLGSQTRRAYLQEEVDRHAALALARTSVEDARALVAELGEAPKLRAQLAGAFKREIEFAREVGERFGVEAAAQLKSDPEAPTPKPN